MSEDDTPKITVPAVCPLCRSVDDYTEREMHGRTWMVCNRCGHPWAPAPVSKDARTGKPHS